jgi:hypothetical protein
MIEKLKQIIDTLHPLWPLSIFIVMGVVWALEARSKRKKAKK